MSYEINIVIRLRNAVGDSGVAFALSECAC
jgi:hypothetical protein